MSSLANRCWTQEREDKASKLVAAAYENDDIEFEHIINNLNANDLYAVAAILAERLAMLAHDLGDDPNA